MNVKIEYIKGTGWIFTDTKTGNKKIADLQCYLTNEQYNEFLHGKKTFQLSQWNTKKWKDKLPKKEIHISKIKQEE